MLITKPTKNNTKATAYIRVSSQRQVDQGVSIDAQKRRIKEYAKFKGLNLDEKGIFIEEGVSGGIPIWDRPKGRALKQKLATGNYSHIICMKLDRMFRLVSDMLHTVDELADAEISFHIVDLNGEAVDTSTSMGRFFLTMMAAMAEMERGLIAERTQEGMNQLKASHRQFTKSIYGWNVTKTGMLEPNWNEQNMIDYMKWQIATNGMSASSVARSLNKRVVRGKRGGKWTGSGVIRTIKNTFHLERKKFPHPPNWGSRPWHKR
jgi:DNA invertase Pin-like site-specific DNA recombinase